MTDQSGSTSGGLFANVVKTVEKAFDFSRTDFESFSHEAMLTMVQHADPEALAGFGDLLTSAVVNINQIGTDLNDHIAYVDWEGTSGAAFKDWGKNVAKSTLALGDYAESTGKAITAAADTLRTVKRDIPKVPAGPKATYDALHADVSARHDPDGQREISQAHTQLETARIQAADQMHKLAQSYSFSAAIINNAKPPTYPPMPTTFVPPSDVRDYDPAHYGSTTSSPMSYTPTSTTTSSHSVAPADHSGVQKVSVTGDNVTHVSTTGSPVATVPDNSSPPVTHIQSTGPLSPVATQPSPLTPNTSNGGGPVLGGPSLGNPLQPVPNQNQQFGGLSPTVQNQVGDMEPINTVGGSRGGTGPFNGRNIAASPTEEIGAAPPMRRSTANGIYGGRPTTEPEMLGGRPQGQVARGSVIGGQGAAARMPAAGMSGGSPGMSGGRNAVNRGNAGRLANEPGGVVGRTPAGEFAPGASRTSDRDRRRNSRRPDHLIEDDDWIPSRDDVAPPVID